MDCLLWVGELTKEPDYIRPPERPSRVFGGLARVAAEYARRFRGFMTAVTVSKSATSNVTTTSISPPCAISVHESAASCRRLDAPASE